MATTPGQGRVERRLAVIMAAKRVKGADESSSIRVRPTMPARRDQGGNNVQRAILAQWRRPYGVRGSDIPRVRGRVLLSSVREWRIRGRCRDAERRYPATARWA